MIIKLGEQLRELRQRDGRTQEDLAQALGVTAQAVSRWEKGICYPDMELLPSVANYFGVSIDNLFGYNNEREKKINDIVERIKEMDLRNNGRDECLDECIRLAREALVEFPGNEKLMLCLASVLFNAGYVRYGEHYLKDDEGYTVYDAKRHKTYPEWQEAIKLYEKLLTTLPEGDMRHQAVRELIRLYVNSGETEKALTLADSAPSLSGCKEMLTLNACEGKMASLAYGNTLLKIVKTCSELMLSSVQVNGPRIAPSDAVEILKNAIGIFDLVCTDGNYGIYHADLACLNMYLSEHLWLAGDRDGAFEALDKALEHAKINEAIREQGEASYTSPLLSMIKHIPNKHSEAGISATLSEDWPWWYDFAYAEVEAEIKKDRRWAEWVKKTKE